MRRILRISLLTALLMWAASACAGDFSLVEYMNIQNAMKPTFDAQGSEFAYLWDVSGIPQVWRASVLGGYPMQVTFFEDGASGCWWSPFGPQSLLVAVPADCKKPVQLWLVNLRSGERERVSEDTLAAHEFGCWASDGSRLAYTVTRKDQSETEIVEYRTDPRQRVSVYRSAGLLRAAAYSPDNRYLLIECVNSAWSCDLHLHDFETGATTRLNEPAGGARFMHPVWDKDGASFHLLTDSGREYLGVAHWPLDSAQFTWIETPEADIEEFAVARDGSSLAWCVRDGGYSILHVRNQRRGVDVPASRFPVGVARDLLFSNDGSKLAYSFAAPDRGHDIWLYEIYADKLNQATSSALGGIPSETFVRPLAVSYGVPDGRTIPALWYAPLKATGKLPVIVAVAAGPNHQARFDLVPWIQYFLSRGWAVLAPDVRGLSGSGMSFAS
ncbi:MAG: hypothetical protein PHI18_07195, partial [bacterium]|nr:hypothetical protein [bacterium]